MSTIQIPAELTVEYLLSAVKQLPPAELREFTRQFSEWQKQNGGRMSTSNFDSGTFSLASHRTGTL